MQTRISEIMTRVLEESQRRQSHAPRLESRATGSRSRVLFLEPNDDGTVGGSYQVLYDFVRHVDRERYEPVVVFYQDNRFVEALRAEGVEVHLLVDVWKRERNAMRSGRPLRQSCMWVEAIIRRVLFLRRERIALLHVNGTPQTGHDDWLPAARILGIPALATCAINVRRDIGSALQRALMRGYSRVLPVSHHVARQLIEFGFGTHQVVTIHPGIDVEAFRSRVRCSATQTRSALGVAPDVMLIALVGNLRPWKGQHVAIEALGLLSPRQREGLQLLLVGATADCDAGYERELRAAVIATGLEAQVQFLGHRDDIPELMAAADVVLHASTEPEPFGLVVVEGMALGRFVLASELGGPSEILEHRIGATFSPARPAELANRLAVLIGHPEHRVESAAAARSHAERFDIAMTVEATTRVYDQLVRTHG
jgi:glycosyltransferase involved in cell wall biosynthesis